jgi:hypothetical protein
VILAGYRKQRRAATGPWLPPALVSEGRRPVGPEGQAEREPN